MTCGGSGCLNRLQFAQQFSETEVVANPFEIMVVIATGNLKETVRWVRGDDLKVCEAWNNRKFLGKRADMRPTSIFRNYGDHSHLKHQENYWR